ncbi:MAG: UDP-N-acetylmuramoyl-L-alanine--D-glutamate ligase [Alcaligenaceae bacterium]|nr:UDP-N-acetylmuramoyl-L-alanine--D-glutamate ligase [Alcaligenaceae bacterium]
MVEHKTLSHSHVLVLGLGETGLASALWCLRQGAKLRVADTREEPSGLADIRAAVAAHSDADISYALGASCLTAETLEGIDSLVLSPGLSPNQSPLKEFLEQAKTQGIEVIGEIELFARALRDLKTSQNYDCEVIAITGTNGKTTVTMMARDMLLAADISAVAAGNISPAALSALMQALDTNDLPQVWVIELSSFQMATVQSLTPKASVVLNLSQDHLDWHMGWEDYVQHKAKLLNLSQFKIVSRLEPEVLTMVPDTEALDVLSFGDDEPQLLGDLGIQVAGGMSWLAASVGDEDFDLPLSANARKRKVQEVSREVGRLKQLMPLEALPVKGRHNALNALAALALCRALDVSWGPMLRALSSFRAAPHRMNFVRTIAGVDFINDSKGTNVGATLAAINGLEQSLVVILGGLAKGQDFSPLLKPLKDKAKGIVLIGRDAKQIEQTLSSIGVTIKHATSMEQAVTTAMSLANAGDIVLLSPACASMDMFSNYMRRGVVFEEAVQELALDHGEI